MIRSIKDPGGEKTINSHIQRVASETRHMSDCNVTTKAIERKLLQKGQARGPSRCKDTLMCRVEQLELQRAHAKAAAQLLHNRHLDEERRTCTCVCEGESRAATGNCQNSSSVSIGTSACKAAIANHPQQSDQSNRNQIATNSNQVSIKYQSSINQVAIK